MKRIPILLCFFISLQWAVLSFADTVYLKNGDVIEGKILRTDENKTIIKTPSDIFQYNAASIDRIEQKPDLGTVAAEALTDDKKELIKRLLQANGVQSFIRQNIQAALTKVSSESKARLKTILNEEELAAAVIPIYADKFSTDDLNNLITFFESPTGRRFVESNLAVSQELLSAIMNYLKTKITSDTSL